MFAYAASMMLGAMALAAVVVALSIRAPRVLLVPLALLCAVAATEAAHIRLPQSTWRVPRTWGRLGPIGFAATFGFALGPGILTALPSACFYVVIYYALTGPPAGIVFLALGLFAAVRAIPLLAIAGLSRTRSQHTVGLVDRSGAIATALAPVEVAVLLMFAMNLLLMEPAL